jgi:PAS domain S-box-containing protein
VSHDLIDSRTAIFDAALDAIVTIDHDGRIVELNTAAERTFGLNRHEANGRLLAETIVPERFRQAHLEGLRRYLETGEARVIGQRLSVAALRADGTEFPAELTIARIPDALPPLFIGFIRDITEARRAERRRAAQYRVAETLAAAPTLEACAPALLDTLREAVDAAFGALWRVDGDVLRCTATRHASDGTAGTFGSLSRAMTFVRGVGLPGRVWQTGQVQRIDNVLEDDNFPRFEAARHEGLHAAYGFPVHLEGEVLAVLEFCRTRAFGQDGDLVQLFHSVGRQLAQFMGRRRAEEDRAQALRREQRARLAAETANNAKDDFVAMISHELRTPLNAILGWSAILKHTGGDDGTRRRAVDAIDRSARAQAQLIEDLLDISRIVRGTLAIAIEPIDGAAVVRAALDVVQPNAESRGVDLRSSGLDHPVPLRADKARLQQIVWNLVSNAIKFTPSGGKVSVALDARDEAMEIVVSDTGIGIRPEFLPHLFERFKQGDIPARSGQRGLGLGLAIVKHLAHAHGGSVTAASDGEGHGSTFTLTLPREHASG